MLHLKLPSPFRNFKLMVICSSITHPIDFPFKLLLPQLMCQWPLSLFLSLSLSLSLKKKICEAVKVQRFSFFCFTIFCCESAPICEKR